MIGQSASLQACQSQGLPKARGGPSSTLGDQSRYIRGLVSAPPDCECDQLETAHQVRVACGFLFTWRRALRPACPSRPTRWPIGPQAPLRRSPQAFSRWPLQPRERLLLPPLWRTFFPLRPCTACWRLNSRTRWGHPLQRQARAAPRPQAAQARVARTQPAARTQAAAAAVVQAAVEGAAIRTA